ncbi:disease resistance protein RPV1-like isoform X2 [Ziziphus jujuba]|uniref:Disease resistance protein RPV1-like isoform X2 n=1 Tax=Ziziphus jujuba TaxID=326968 RepID=A0ABM4ACN5_ZIZJJ|nr:disease resistance protein RPV1-like isoform X2 [Ziziphus jujuba]
MSMASSSSSFSAAGAASAISPQEKHEVFLSFRGEDTRNGFTSYLYDALCRKQILTYMDNHQLERGDEISPTLLKAIEESKISMIIFSENYATSTWCLDELVKILECKKRNEQIVVPIFYGVEPSVVRKQEESYADAFAKLEERFKDNMDKVQQWRRALNEVAGLKGFNSMQFRPENTLIGKIVEDISLLLHKYPSSNEQFKGLIGIEKGIKEIESLIHNSSMDVCIIGIWGMGGIGKTTLASAVFQKFLYSHFEGYCSLWNVKEESARHGLVHLREKLLGELLQDEAIVSRDTPFVQSTFVHQRFRRKKALIVLDDVDCPIQLETLIEGYDQFAPGSRIIVTTRNVQVLKKVTDKIYTVEGLDEVESLKLFHLHAFGKNSLTTDYEILSEMVASYANGNPLALRVLGSFLRFRSKGEWESALDKLKLVPNQDIQNVLRISYEGLDDIEKQVFLDIACFFENTQNQIERLSDINTEQEIFLDIKCFFEVDEFYTRDQVESIVAGRGSSAKIAISVLIDKSLITIDDDNRIRMHNLLQEMGWAIVRDEHKLPGNRSRLWIAEDVCHVLERDTGTATIEGILFDMSKFKKDVKVSPTAFSNMHNLRFLKIYYDDIENGDSNCELCLPQGLDSYLSDRLRYFHWDLYPLKHLPSDFTPENLVVLILRGSQLELLWNEAQPLAKLKEIDLSYSKFLTQIPNLSQALNLESINLSGCIRLFQVPSYFKNLHKLKFIDWTGCTNLVDVEGILGRIEYLDNENYGEIIQSNNIFQKLTMNLRHLKLCGTAIEEIPSSIGCLLGLIELDLRDCRRLKSLPTSICKLKSLESLNLSHCPKLEKFPEILEPMERLKLVILSQSMIEELPESIENLIGLEELFLSDCKNIGFFPNKFCKLSHLGVLHLHGCSKLQELLLPVGLRDLRLSHCVSLKSISEFPPMLRTLNASFCTSLEKIPCWNSRIKHIALNLLTETHGLVDFSLVEEFINFSNCQKVDCSTRNIIAHYASLNSWFRARSREPFSIYVLIFEKTVYKLWRQGNTLFQMVVGIHGSMLQPIRMMPGDFYHDHVDKLPVFLNYLDYITLDIIEHS